MPITLTTSGVPWARYKVTTGKLAFSGEGTPAEVDLAGLQFAADPENSVPGWLKVANKSRDFVRAVHGKPPPPSPDDEYIWTLALLIYSPRVLGDLVYEICDTSLAFRRFAQKLFNETEPDFGKGTIPLVKVVEIIRTANGSSAQITYKVEKWIPRPDAFAEAIDQRDEAAGKHSQPASAAPSGNAYARATGVEQPAAAPAVKPSFGRELDDEIPF